MIRNELDLYVEYVPGTTSRYMTCFDSPCILLLIRMMRVHDKQIHDVLRLVIFDRGRCILMM